MSRISRLVNRYVQHGKRSWKLLVLLCCLLYGVFFMALDNTNVIDASRQLSSEEKPEILLITPTGNSTPQLAHLTRLSQTLSLVSNIHWILVEDHAHKSEKIVNLLKRTKIRSTHLFFETPPRFPGRGWAQRNYALAYLRNNFRNASKTELKKIVYFADDDNTYDIRLFDKYIRKVKRIGVWAVGFAGAALVEAPRVNRTVVVGWKTGWAPNRRFAVDMAGFAVSLELVLNTNATFEARCDKRKDGPETCFIEQFGVDRGDLEPFGVNDEPLEVLVWHTKTEKYKPLLKKSDHGYIY